jgi:hypothetical protein
LEVVNKFFKHYVSSFSLVGAVVLDKYFERKSILLYEKMKNTSGKKAKKCRTFYQKISTREFYPLTPIWPQSHNLKYLVPDRSE